MSDQPPSAYDAVEHFARMTRGWVDAVAGEVGRLAAVDDGTLDADTAASVLGRLAALPLTVAVNCWAGSGSGPVKSAETVTLTSRRFTDPGPADRRRTLTVLDLRDVFDHQIPVAQVAIEPAQLAPDAGTFKVSVTVPQPPCGAYAGTVRISPDDGTPTRSVAVWLSEGVPTE